MNLACKSFILGFISFFILSFSSNNILPLEESQLVFSQLTEKINTIKTMEFILTNEERIEGSMLKGIQKVTMNTSPFQCHITMIEPGKGEELIYAGSKYKNQAIYEPSGFPYFQIELDPYGSLMRKNNHHTIFDLGFKKMMMILDYHMKSSAYKMTVTEMEMDKKKIYKIEIDFTNFKYYNLKVDRTETISDIAKRLFVSDYMLSVMNNVNYYDNLKAGSTIIVPSAYAKKIELYIDRSNGLPFAQVVYDDHGIYEKYEFSDLKINIPIPEKRYDAEMLGKTL